MEQGISQNNITIMHKLHHHLTKTKLIKKPQQTTDPPHLRQILAVGMVTHTGA